ncbi:hypothetical protein U3516DRAFT_827012 [Neocallimastix sp. 'constans']
MDIDCDWCICGKKTTNGNLYCSEECRLSECASDSSVNSDYSYFSNSSYASMMTVTNYMPTLYSKKINKNYSSMAKSNHGSNKACSLGYKLCTINTKGYINKNITHSSLSSQSQASSVDNNEGKNTVKQPIGRYRSIIQSKQIDSVESITSNNNFTPIFFLKK